MTDPQPGDYGVLLYNGRNPIKNLVIAIVCWGSRSKAYHAIVWLGAGWIVQAEPGGAKRTPDIQPSRYVWSHVPMTDAQREIICRAAVHLVGTPYNWLDDLALGLTRRFGWRLPGFILRRVQRTDRLQCAQLVDLCYRRAGVRLFDDGRVPGAVTPGDLYDLIETSTT